MTKKGVNMTQSRRCVYARRYAPLGLFDTGIQQTANWRERAVGNAIGGYVGTGKGISERDQVEDAW